MIIIPIDLDPAHPTLDDHRPGGLPLFGTAMGLGAMVSALRSQHPSITRICIEDVRIAEPCILSTDAAHRLETVLGDIQHNEGGSFRDALVRTPQRADEAEVAHFRARLRGDMQPSDSTRSLDPPSPIGLTVTGDEIYQVFFHGPSFQVVGAVQRNGDTLTAHLSDLPASRALMPEVRLIEFAMQAAGLLELSLSGEMRVPLRIGRITLSIDEQVLTGATATVAQHGKSSLSGRSSDIHISAKSGTEILAIAAYETVELPFPIDQSSLKALGHRIGCLPQ